MEFIIKYRNGLQSDIYQKWPEELTNKNSRAFKKVFNQVEYEKTQIYWILSNYIGPKAESDFYFHQQHDENKDIPGITLNDINNFFSNYRTIQEEYSPKEGDQLIIFKDFFYEEIKNVKRTGSSFQRVSYIFRNGEWINDYYLDILVKTKIVLNGILKV